MSRIVKKTALHAVGVILFLSLPFLFSLHITNFNSLIHFKFFQEDLTACILLVLMFYLMYEILIPKLYNNKRYFLFFISISILALIIITAPRILVDNFGLTDIEEFRRPQKNLSFRGKPHRMPPPSWLFTKGKFLFEFLIVFSTAFIIRLNQKLKDVTNEKLEAQLSFLKAQINPHFLFNTLNSIYSLAINKSDETADAIIKLSDLMRYVITETNQSFVPLRKEIEYAQNYIDLQKLRCNKSVNINFTVNGNSSNLNIAPLILIPFIENAFKHGINTEGESEINIDINIKENILYMKVFNYKHLENNIKENNSKLGINNTKNRLNLIYSNKYSLKIESNEKHYTTNLKIEL